MCGEKTLSVDEFTNAIYSLALLYAAINLAPSDTIIFDANMSSYDINPLKAREILLAGRYPRLLDILFMLGYRNAQGPYYCASNPSDILFGLLGVIDESDRILDVEYAKPVEIIFTAITRNMYGTFFERGFPQSSFSLEWCHPRREVGNIPSWVPDWIEVGMNGIGANPINSMDISDATAGTISLDNTSDDLENLVLTMNGCVLDVVTEVMEPWKTTNNAPPTVEDRETPAWAESVLTFMGTSAADIKNSAAMHLWRPLTCDFNMKEDSIDRVRCLMHRRDVHSDPLTDHEISLLLLRISDEDRATITKEQINEVWALERWFLMRNLENRTLCKTATGMLRRCHHVVKAGDLVTLLWGIKTPIILRKRQGYIFRGDSYVDGVMHGEFLERGPEEMEFNIY